MSGYSYDDYIRPFYKRSRTVSGTTSADFAKAAFLAFIAEFPEFPLQSGNTEFLTCCLENYFQQN